jgi:hypothetical protein
MTPAKTVEESLLETLAWRLKTKIHPGEPGKTAKEIENLMEKQVHRGDCWKEACEARDERIAELETELKGKMAPPANDFRDSPIAWASQLLCSHELGKYDACIEAQKQLNRLGWDMKRCVKPAPAPARTRKKKP